MVSPRIILVICFSYTTHSEPHALYYCTHCIWGYTVHTAYGGTLYRLHMGVHCTHCIWGYTVHTAYGVHCTECIYVDHVGVSILSECHSAGQLVYQL